MFQFYCEPVKTLFRDLNINHYPSRNSVKSIYAENAIKFVKTKIYRFLAHFNRKRYIEVLKKIENAWNHDSAKGPLPNLSPTNVSIDRQTGTRNLPYSKNGI